MYASGTTVAVMQSRTEIAELLKKMGAIKTGVAEEPGAALIYFHLGDRIIKMLVPIPTEHEVRGKSKAKLTESQVRQRMAKAERERWRALVLALKAKFVSIEAGVETFEEAFLAHVVMPGGDTVYQRARPLIEESYATGKVPTQFLLGPGAP